MSTLGNSRGVKVPQESQRAMHTCSDCSFWAQVLTSRPINKQGGNALIGPDSMSGQLLFLFFQAENDLPLLHCHDSVLLSCSTADPAQDRSAKLWAGGTPSGPRPRILGKAWGGTGQRGSLRLGGCSHWAGCNRSGCGAQEACGSWACPRQWAQLACFLASMWSELYLQFLN